MKNILKRLSIITLVIMLLTGCGTKPYTQEELFDYLNDSIGKTYTLIDSKDVESTDEHITDIKEYSFTSKYGFDFTVQTYISHSYDGIPTSSKKVDLSDYKTKLWGIMHKEIKKVLKKSKLDYKYGANEHYTYQHNLKFILNNYNDIDKVYSTLNNIIEVFDKYTYKEFDFDYIYIYKGNTLIARLDKNLFNDYRYKDKKIHLDSLKVLYKDNIKNNIISDNTVSIDELNKSPYININKLYINNAFYISEKYKDYKFVYSPQLNKYLAVVTFGKKFDYNGGVEDYMQREIITNYLKGTYKIENDKATYTIGDNTYLAYIKDANIYIKKNNKKSSIKIQESPLYWNTSTGATYYYYITIDDFAELLDCTYIVEGDTIYLNSK